MTKPTSTLATTDRPHSQGRQPVKPYLDVDLVQNTSNNRWQQNAANQPTSNEPLACEGVVSGPIGQSSTR